jgi:hypothetical protein
LVDIRNVDEIDSSAVSNNLILKLTSREICVLELGQSGRDVVLSKTEDE